MENGKKNQVKNVFVGSDFVCLKKVHVMFLRVLEVFLGVLRAALAASAAGASMGLNHGLEHGKWKNYSKSISLGSDFVVKKVHVMCLHVLEVFVGCLAPAGAQRLPA